MYVHHKDPVVMRVADFTHFMLYYSSLQGVRGQAGEEGFEVSAV